MNKINLREDGHGCYLIITLDFQPRYYKVPYFLSHCKMLLVLYLYMVKINEHAHATE